MANAYAIIMAGGNGERFWPLSAPERFTASVVVAGMKDVVVHTSNATLVCSRDQLKNMKGIVREVGE